MAFERMRVFTGNANPKLAEAVCRHLNISLGRCVVGRFSDGEVMVELLENAESRGIIAIDGNRIHFAHPLLARGVYTEAAPGQRRTMHRRLADIVDEPELRARHLALAATSLCRKSAATSGRRMASMARA